MAIPTIPARPSPTASSPAPSLDALRGLLLDQLAAEERNVAELYATAAALAGQTDTDSLLERELAERAEARSRQTIEDIRHALARMDDGTYGTCERCGDAIPIERLEVIPFTRRCVACPEGATSLLG